MTISQFKKDIIQKFQSSQGSASQTPSLDTEVLLCHALNFTKTQLLLNQNTELPPEKSAWLQQAVQQRLSGMPIAYITGHKEFFGYDFLVDSSTLIPKPDTEILVENALDIIIKKTEAHPDSLLTICDMCTGTGCIGLSVYKALKEIYKMPEEKLPSITMVDLSGNALDLAKKNAKLLIGSDSNLRFVQSNLFEMIPNTFDIILTNPPYIPGAMVDELLQDGRNEPRLALDGDIDEAGNRSNTDDGLDIIRRLIIQTHEKLSPYGTVLMEAGEYNIEKAELLAKKEGFKNTQIILDLSNQKRILIYHK